MLYDIEESLVKKEDMLKTKSLNHWFKIEFTSGCACL